MLSNCYQDFRRRGRTDVIFLVTYSVIAILIDVKPIPEPSFILQVSGISYLMALKFDLHPDLRRDGIVLGKFPLCLLLLINDSNFPWFVLVPQRAGLRDLIDLDLADYQVFWEESAELSRALRTTFKCDKLNLAALGNVTPQLHVHHIVRYHHDPAWPAPIWGKQPMRPYQSEEVAAIREHLKSAQIRGLEIS